MLKKPVILSCAVLALFSSCKSLQLSSNANSSPAKNTSSRNLEFLNNISVTPGGKAATIPEPYGSIKQSNRSTKSFADAEAMDLKVKYASLLNADAHDLTNPLLLQNIDYWWGTRYCMGGSNENCLDCSAFTQIIMHSVYNLDVPRTAQQQYDESKRVDAGDLQEGDLVFFHTAGRGISHVGIYLVNNKFVHATTSSGVTISDLNDPYWQPKYRGAGRMK